MSPTSDEEALSLLRKYQVHFLVHRFRPLGGKIRNNPLLRKLQHLYEVYKDSIKIYHYTFDLQHSLDYVSHLFEAIIAKMYKTPYIFTQRNLLVNGNLLATRIKAYFSNKVIAISESVKTLLYEIGVPKTKIRYIPNGIDTDSVSFAWEWPREPIVLAVGQVIRLKGYEDTLRVFSNLVQEFPQLQLYIIGPIIDHTYYMKLQQLSIQLGISGRVFFLGSQNDVLAYMKRASVLIHCSRSEGFGWVLLEAMAVGLPVVSANFSAATEIIRNGETGFLVKHGEIEGFVNAIRSILTNPNFAYKIAKQARAEVEQKFSARRVAEQIAEVYREVIQEVRR